MTATDRRWLKMLAVPSSPIETVSNVEIWPLDAPPAPVAPVVGQVSAYYLDGHDDTGAALPVGPGFVRCRGAFYAPDGGLAYAPDGVSASATLADQIQAD